VAQSKAAGRGSGKRISPLGGAGLWLVVFAMFAAVLLPLVSLDRAPRSRLQPRSATLESRCYRHNRVEKRFARKMNKARRRSGRRRLSLDPEASKVAMTHTRSMFRRATLFHSPHSQLGRRVTRWSVLGENIGVGGGVKSLHKAFMASQLHRANILYSRFRHVGVGAAKKRGRLWVTVVFESRRDPGTRLRMPRC
jgi:uncharacterized protein YkwD